MTDPTRAAYDAVAAEYEKQIADELAGTPLDRALLAAFAELAGKGTVADVGCGPGHVAGHLATLGCDMLGIVMIAFHVSDATHAAGEAVAHDEFLGIRVELVHHFLDPDDVAA